MKGFGGIVGFQAGVSNANTVTDLSGKSVSGSVSYGSGLAVGLDGSISLTPNSAGHTLGSVNLTVGYGGGGKAVGGTIMNTIVLPFCKSKHESQSFSIVVGSSFDR